MLAQSPNRAIGIDRVADYEIRRNYITGAPYFAGTIAGPHTSATQSSLSQLSSNPLGQVHAPHLRSDKGSPIVKSS